MSLPSCFLATTGLFFAIHTLGFGVEAGVVPTQTSIPFDQLGAEAQKSYKGDAIGITATHDGAKLRAGFQKLDGIVTREGLRLESTDAGGDTLKLTATAIGRTDAIRHALPPAGTVHVYDQRVAFIRPGLVEEYSTSMDGVRQDFIVMQRPAGAGRLDVELSLSGARAEKAANGVKLTLEKSGRELAYSRLKVTDATGKELTATMETPSADRITIRVDDAAVVYPVRIDPTFSDADWVGFKSGESIPNGRVKALVSDGSGNLYLGGDFTAIGSIAVNGIAKWDGSLWSALGTGPGVTTYSLAFLGTELYAGGSFGLRKWNGTTWAFVSNMGSNGYVYSLAVSGSDLYVGGLFTVANGGPADRIARWNGTAWSALGTGTNGIVYALAVSGSNLYVGGDFSSAGGVANTARIARWDGGAWSALGTGTSSTVYALAVSGSDLYVGGAFSSAGGVANTSKVAKWNGIAWSALGTGTSSTVYALAVSGSDLYVGGDFSSAGGVANTARIARWSGSSWVALGAGSSANSVPVRVQSLAIIGSSIYAGGGAIGGEPTQYLAQFDGSTWSVVGAGMNGTVNALAVDGTDLYIGGTFTSVVGTAASRIARWDGSAWSSLGLGVNGSVEALVMSGLGLYVGGSFTTAGGVAASRIARWDGSAWSALGSGTSGTVNALAVGAAGIYAGGSFTTAGGVTVNRVALWNGSAWSAFGTGTSGTVNALVVNGTNVYAGGSFTTAGGVTVNNVARWTGSAWVALGTGTNATVYALASGSAGLYAGGNFTSAGGAAASRIALWNGAAWSALGSGVNNTVNALATIGPVLYAGGTFTTAGGGTVNLVAVWNGSAWSALDTGMDSGGTINALALIGTDLYGGGQFTTAGGLRVGNLARWNGSAWLPLSSEVNDIVRALAVSGTDVYAGGDFTTAGGVTVNGIAKWNGSTWSALGSGISGGLPLSKVNALAVSGTDVYAGGDFTTAGGVTANNIAKWNGSTWSALGSGTAGGGVNAIVISGPFLYVGGSFTAAGGVANTARIARWNGTSWSAMGTGIDGPVNALAASPSFIYAGGSFNSAGGVANTAFIAKWDGSAWSALGSGMDSFVFALAVSGTDVYAGGSFTTAGGLAASRIAKWNGSAWSALGSGIGGSSPMVFALAASGTDVYAGGDFTTAGGVAASRIAKWNGSIWSALGSGISSLGFPNAYALAVDTSGNPRRVFVGGDFGTAGRKVSPFLAQANVDAVTEAPTLTTPAANASSNSPVAVAFTLPEAALAGSVTLTFTGAVTRVLTLASSEETAGAHSFSFNTANPTGSAQIASGTAIPDGVYSVTLSYQDQAGNAAASDSSANITLDSGVTQTPTLTAPATNTKSNSPVSVNFTLPEAASNGTLTLTFTGAVTRVLTLANSQGTVGAHSFSFNPVNPTATTQIASGSAIPDGSYTVTLSYQDVLGNAAASASSTNVTIDTITLTPTLTAPATGTVTASPVMVTFTLPETAQAGSVTLTFPGAGTLTLASSQETAGAHSFSFNPANPTASPQIVSGTAIGDNLYTVTLSYRDALGNTASTAASTSVRVDTLAPSGGVVILTPTSPVDPGASLNVNFQSWFDARTPLTYTVLVDDVVVSAQGTNSSRNFTGPVASGTHVLKGRIFDSLGNMTEQSQNFTVRTPSQMFSNTMANALLAGGDAQPLATPKNDGIANLLKYAFNMNLTAPDVRLLTPGTGTAGLPSITAPSPGILRIEFVQRTSAGLTYAPKKSSSLGSASWTPLTATPTVTPIDAQWERVVYSESFTPGITSALFGRLEVTLPP